MKPVRRKCAAPLDSKELAGHGLFKRTTAGQVAGMLRGIVKPKTDAQIRPALESAVRRH